MKTIDTSKPQPRALDEEDKQDRIEQVQTQDHNQTRDNRRSRALFIALMYSESTDCDGKDDAFKALIHHHAELEAYYEGDVFTGEELLRKAGL